jgi:MFS transporter, PHS family, inorganic phosphate transporter
LGLNNSIVLSATGYIDGETLYHKLYNNAVGMIILSVAGSLPGYWAAVFTIDTIGRKPLQVGGFLVLTILFCILGFAYHSLSAGSLFALYIIAQFFFNLGPNSTTFIVPGECFPTRYRATSHGISAAAGKIGAIIAQIISLPFMTKKDGEEGARVDILLQIFALFMLCGVFTSFLIPETKGLTLEELSGEPPTSYNSGRNGSISSNAAPSWRWNPFSGGKPAGFTYSRSRGTRRSSWKRWAEVATPTTGTSSDPETGKPTPVKRDWWRRAATRRHGSNSDFGMSSSTSSTRIIGSDAPFTPPTDNSPTWNAGWGRIERGRPPENIKLEDVGGLVAK